MIKNFRLCFTVKIRNIMKQSNNLQNLTLFEVCSFWALCCKISTFHLPSIFGKMKLMMSLLLLLSFMEAYVFSIYFWIILVSLENKCNFHLFFLDNKHCEFKELAWDHRLCKYWWLEMYMQRLRNIFRRSTSILKYTFLQIIFHPDILWDSSMVQLWKLKP